MTRLWKVLDWRTLLCDDPVSFKIKLCGQDYFKMRPNGEGHRLNMHWGFEKYEEEKQKIMALNLDPDDYERRILELSELLGI